MSLVRFLPGHQEQYQRKTPTHAGWRFAFHHARLMTV
jgi:hypothetical protein